MSQLKVRAIVIESSNKGENDKWLTLLCKDKGKITVKARNCRKPTSKLFSCTTLFTYADFIIDDHFTFNHLVSGDIIRHFFIGCDDIKTLSIANYLLAATNNMLKHGQEENEIMYLLLKALQALDKQINDIRLIGYIFEIKSLVIIGYMPYMDNCINCNNPYIQYFHPEGMLCVDCATKESVQLMPDTYLAINTIIAYDADEVFKLKYPSRVLQQISKCSRLMMQYYTELDFHAYNFLNYLNWY